MSAWYCWRWAGGASAVGVRAGNITGTGYRPIRETESDQVLKTTSLGELIFWAFSSALVVVPQFCLECVCQARMPFRVPVEG